MRLSRKEFDMMEMLMLNQKLVITKEKAAAEGLGL